jgi:hypothetical protein
MLETTQAYLALFTDRQMPRSLPVILELLHTSGATPLALET